MTTTPRGAADQNFYFLSYLVLANRLRLPRPNSLMFIPFSLPPVRIDIRLHGSHGFHRCAACSDCERNPNKSVLKYVRIVMVVRVGALIPGLGVLLDHELKWFPPSVTIPGDSHFGALPGLPLIDFLGRATEKYIVRSKTKR